MSGIGWGWEPPDTHEWTYVKSKNGRAARYTCGHCKLEAYRKKGSMYLLSDGSKVNVICAVRAVRAVMES